MRYFASRGWTEVPSQGEILFAAFGYNQWRHMGLTSSIREGQIDVYKDPIP